MESKNSIAGYIRVSTYEQVVDKETKQKKSSLEIQEEAIKNYAAGQGGSIYKIYDDAGISGAKDDRPGLMKMMADAKAGKFSKICFYKLDRFGRSIRQILDNYDTLEKLGVALISIRENIDTSTAMGRMVRNVLATLAEFERELISERTYPPKLAKMREKKILVSKRPHGYLWNKIERRFEVVEEEKEAIQKIFKYYSDPNLPIDKLWHRLKEEGIRNREGRTFHPTTLAKMLHRECYGTGKFYLLKTVKDKDGRRVERPKIEWIEYETPIIVDKKTWEKVQRKLKDSTSQPKNFKRDDPFILRGLLKCGECGGSITTLYSGKRKFVDGNRVLWRYYVCRHRVIQESRRSSFPEKRKRKCDLPMIRAEKIEKHVIDSVVYDLGSPYRVLQQLRQEFEQEFPDHKEAEKKLQGINVRLGKAEENLSRWLDLYAEGKYDRSTLQRKHDETLALIEDLRREKEGLESRLDEYERTTQNLSEAKKAIPDLKKLATGLIEAIEGMIPEQKKSFITSIFGLRQIEVSRLRRGDLLDAGEKLPKKEMIKPIGREYQLYGEGSFDLSKAAEILKNYIGNRRLSLEDEE